ncbi:hypothetical protein C5167_009636 [Papaver somniferum]|uniref:Subtilisin-like protease n=1 Tax=Papaver somniferum TaxID=3469 RepID=A0A4Y7JZ47_PAPSO|nr:subtilisin-like protease SBT5.4 [Papaver somniferum]RZC65947.1 hypothetical protein C5167_009636 [Papaver somniferum]
MRGFGGPLSSLVLIILFALLQKSAFAVKPISRPGKKSYIVYMGAHSHGAEATSADLDKATDAHFQLLSTVVGSNEKARESMFYSYRRYINGFAAVLDQHEADEISKYPSVFSVFENEGRQLHTTHSWNFLGLESESGDVSPLSAWNIGRYGEDTIIANLDTGVWPESKSFSDEGMGPIPSRWKGTCQNNSKDGVPCNKKLIGARYFINGYAAGVDSYEIPTNLSARDYDGHGTHTLSTAGGNFVSGANVFGFGKGTAKGGAPKSRVAAYKVCWKPINDSGCYDADIIAAFEAAIHDGVDIISASIGGPPADYFSDGIAIGSFHAVKHGITVVTSAGNNGAVEGGVSNTAPWLITVGANTIDREFPVEIGLGNRKHLKGQSLYPKALPIKKFYPLINGTSAKAANSTNEDARLCFAGSLDPAKVKGKILACIRGISGRVEKGIVALQAGAAGMILANDEANGRETVADPHVLLSAHITYIDGLALFSYIGSTKSPGAIMTRARTQYGVNPVPVVAAFSSRGPNVVTPEILKPDVTAPGVDIIAAFTQAIGPAGETDDRRVLFNTESGTSMSCPHIAGVAALIKTVHPDWSPSAIKSAIMTTARTQDSQKVAMRNSSNLQATPFNYGSGQVRPNAVLDPGLVYDVTTNDYLNFLCGLGYDESQLKPFTPDMPYKCPESYTLTDFNYPSITVPDLQGSITVTRTVKNVGSPGTYKAQIHAPQWIRVSVEPKTLTFEKIGEEKMFKVTLKAVYSSEQYTFGRLTWTDGVHFVRSTIVVRGAPGPL